MDSNELIPEPFFLCLVLNEFRLSLTERFLRLIEMILLNEVYLTLCFTNAVQTI